MRTSSTLTLSRSQNAANQNNHALQHTHTYPQPLSHLFLRTSHVKPRAQRSHCWDFPTPSTLRCDVNNKPSTHTVSQHSVTLLTHDRDVTSLLLVNTSCTKNSTTSCGLCVAWLIIDNYDEWIPNGCTLLVGVSTQFFLNGNNNAAGVSSRDFPLNNAIPRWMLSIPDLLQEISFVHWFEKQILLLWRNITLSH